MLPGNTILDRMDAELETGEFRAPRPIEIPSKEEVEQAEEDRSDKQGVQAFPVLTANGVVRMTQSIKAKVPPVEDPEEFRTRTDLLATAVEFTKIKNPTNVIIATADKEMWNDHKDYILGTDVRLHEVKDDDDSLVVARPTWGLVMSYEFKVRQKAAELMSGEHGKPVDIKAAFRAAQKCSDTRRNYLLERLHLQQVHGPQRGSGSRPSGHHEEAPPTKKTKQAKQAAK